MNKSSVYCLLVLLLIGCSQIKNNNFSHLSDRNSLFELELGHYLFFDKKLSFNLTKSCASCHDPKLAFTDGYRRSLGATADLHQRNSSSLLNISQNIYFTSADSTLINIEKQLLLPLFNNKVVELGLTGYEKEVLFRIRNDETYQKIFKKYKQPINNLNWKILIIGLASYCRSLNSYNSKYDKFLASNDTSILTQQEAIGMQLFFSDSLGCSKCHAGKNFNQPIMSNMSTFTKNGFFEVQISNVNTLFSPDYGLFNISGKESDIGRFRIPSLRNVLVTSPYMHDGSFVSLPDVIKTYGKGGIHSEKNANNLKKFRLSKSEIEAVIIFLNTLTDTSYLSNPTFISPFQEKN